ncbi:hypothetical protein ABID21_004164 [Pseudorhizobium tarimense]|uniref:DUF1468 domain-containing protein n=1 Tax=Pseudorhizobium tarimense TaxID=1079109 RepID=A0ABV2HBU8_9HYPH|nr:tripartite tricarboxylate transporter TctB family protein [Pseudorhizobium tarimense]MCJ8521106.1 tripartite tricarboxylate transporter TctB family protein [Pseudorhizobium tarimense]
MFRRDKYGFEWAAWVMFAAIPAFIFWQAATSLEEQGAASGGPLENAALYPLVIASLMILVVIVQFVRILFRRTNPPQEEQQLDTPRALAVTVLFMLYLIGLPSIGFHILTPLLCAIMMRSLGLSWMRAVFGALVLWLVCSFVFEGLLNVVLPVGMFNLALFS